MVERFAVYGTLRPKASAEPRHLLEAGLLVNEGAMTLNGWQMFSLGGYPGIKESEDRDDLIVVNILRRGEECSDEQWQSIISGFDRYEGYREADKRASLYLRHRVHTTNGPAYIYVYNHPTDGRERIEDGDWLSYRYR